MHVQFATKLTLIQTFLLDHDVDVITETWLTDGDEVTPRQLLPDPDGYSFISVPRNGLGGGLGIVAKSHISIKLRPPQKCESFECAEFDLRAASLSTLLVAVYRPSPSTQNGLSRIQFLTDFTPFQEDLVTRQDNFIIMGDFNIHIDNLDNPEAAQFANLLNDCNGIQLPVPWYTGDLQQQKRHVRRAERRWRKSGLPVDRKEFTKQRNIFTDMASVAKKDHIKQKIKDCYGDQKLLFRLVNELLGRSKSKRLPTIYDSEADLANMFSDFFHEKISNIRNVLSNFSASGTARETFHPPSSTWLSFQLVSLVEVSKIIKSSPCKSCALDPVPTWMVKAAPERFADIIVKIINSSLETGIVPDIFKRAHVTPLLKKTTLDPDSLDNYRPISQLQFVSKVLEKVVGNFLCKYLKGNDLFENLQSAYQPGQCGNCSCQSDK
ncbi:uncharacterized protein [Diadema setosum]|uniref:uncharacterized protein n=1 Tax=Diadema setosum TaxID=31175 RepID=UPI003B3ACFB5